MQNKVIVHHVDGRLQKGVTEDFFPNKNFFHLIEKEGGTIVQIGIHDLKAVFFVKSFEGNPAYNEQHDIERKGFGRKIRVVFNDGETVTGYTQGFSAGRDGFFVFPDDPQSNNERIFVITSATKDISFLQ